MCSATALSVLLVSLGQFIRLSFRRPPPAAGEWRSSVRRMPAKTQSPPSVRDVHDPICGT